MLRRGTFQPVAAPRRAIADERVYSSTTVRSTVLRNCNKEGTGMKIVIRRIALALAVASYICVASAAPPQPTAVTVVNPVLPVEVTNADPIVVSQLAGSTPFTNSMDFVFSVQRPAGTSHTFKNALGVAMFVTGIFMAVSSDSPTKSSSRCQATFNLLNADETLGIGLSYAQATSSNSMTSPYVPFPRLELPAGSKYQFTIVNETDSDCTVTVNMYAIRQQPL